MKSKVMFLWVLIGCSIGGFAASTAMAEPVWRELESYSEKDKTYVEQRGPQLEGLDKQITELKSKPANKATSSMLAEVEAKKKLLVGELTEHEFRISTDVAGFANTRSKDAETRLKQLRGDAGDASQPKELRDFEERVKKERAALEEELKKLPPDAEEVARQELQARLRQISNEEDEKIRKIPAGPKKIKRDEFEKRVTDERKTLREKLGIPASPSAPPPGPQAQTEGAPQL